MRAFLYSTVAHLLISGAASANTGSCKDLKSLSAEETIQQVFSMEEKLFLSCLDLMKEDAANDSIESLVVNYLHLNPTYLKDQSVVSTLSDWVSKTDNTNEKIILGVTLGQLCGPSECNITGGAYSKLIAWVGTESQVAEWLEYRAEEQNKPHVSYSSTIKAELPSENSFENLVLDASKSQIFAEYLANPSDESLARLRHWTNFYIEELLSLSETVLKDPSAKVSDLLRVYDLLLFLNSAVQISNESFKVTNKKIFADENSGELPNLSMVQEIFNNYWFLNERLVSNQLSNDLSPESSLEFTELFGAFIGQLGSSSFHEDLAKSLALENGISWELLSDDQKATLMTLTHPSYGDKAIELASELESQLSDSSENLLQDIESSWNEFVAANEDMSFEDLSAFEQVVVDTGIREKIREQSKIIEVVQKSFDDHEKSICSSEPGLSLQSPCSDESDERQKFRSAYSDLSDSKIRFTMLRNLIDLITIGNYSVKDDFLLAYRELESLHRNQFNLPGNFVSFVSSRLEKKLKTALESTLRRDFVEINAGLKTPQTALVNKFISSVETDFNSLSNLISELEKAERAQEREDQCDIEDSLLSSTIENLRFQKDQALSVLSDQLLEIDRSIDQYESQKADSQTSLNLIDNAASMWCETNLAGPYKEKQIGGCKKFQTRSASLEEITFFYANGGRIEGGNLVPNYVDYRYTASPAILSEYLGLLEQHKQESRSIKAIDDQIASLKEKQNGIQNSASGIKEKTKESFDSQIAAQEKLQSDRKALCSKGQSFLIDSEEVQIIFDRDFLSAIAKTRYIIDSISYYQRLLGEVSTIGDSVDLSSLASAEKVQDKRFQLGEFIKEINSSWTGLGNVAERLTGSLDNRVERIIIPMSPILYKNGKGLFKQQESELTAVQDMAELNLLASPDKIKSCVASEVHKKIKNIDDRLPALAGELKYQLTSEDIDWRLEANHIFNWDEMKSWYGHQMRQATSSAERSEIRTVWALWKYHRMYSQYWSTYRRLNSPTADETVSAELTFDIGADLVQGAESSFIVGMYPTNVLDTDDIYLMTNGTVDDYLLSNCSAESMITSEIHSCNSRLNLNFFFNLQQKTFLGVNKNSIEFFQLVLNALTDAKYWNQDVFKLGIQLSDSLRGQQPLMKNFTLGIESLPRTQDISNSYTGSALVITLLKNFNISNEESMEWLSSKVVYPKNSASDKFLSDIYFPKREAALFDGKSPHEWLLFQEELTEECEELKSSLGVLDSDEEGARDFATENDISWNLLSDQEKGLLIALNDPSLSSNSELASELEQRLLSSAESLSQGVVSGWESFFLANGHPSFQDLSAFDKVLTSDQVYERLQNLSKIIELLQSTLGSHPLAQCPSYPNLSLLFSCPQESEVRRKFSSAYAKVEETRQELVTLRSTLQLLTTNNSSAPEELIDLYRDLTSRNESSEEIFAGLSEAVKKLNETEPIDELQDLVGKIPVTAKVSENGASILSIPVKVPEGVNGMTPQLSLAYSNTSDSGVIGSGFILVGESQIARCKGPVELGSEATSGSPFVRFCLDGIPLLLSSDGGDHGAEGSRYITQVASQDQIVAHGQHKDGPEYFSVIKPNSKIYTYGREANSRVEGEELVWSWSLNSIHDAFGNIMYYNYAIVDGERLLDTIEYTAYDPSLSKFSTQEPANQAPGPFTVKFEYEKRSHTRQYVQTGASHMQSHLLHRINIFKQDERLWFYDLKYGHESSSEKKVLTQLDLCSSSDRCFAPLSFSWSDDTLGYKYSDRKTFGNTFGLTSSSNEQAIKIADINGDGFSDLLLFNQRGVHIAYNDKNGEFLRPKIVLFDNFDLGRGWKLARDQIQLHDINRDGFTDIVGFSNNGVMVSLGSKDGPLEPTIWSQDFKSSSINWDKDDKRLVSDVNNDGLPDIIGANYEGVFVALQSSGKFEPARQWLDELTLQDDWDFSKHEFFVFDINRDGFPDILGRKDDVLYISYNQGNGFSDPEEVSHPILARFNRSYDLFSVIDINSDGFADLTVINGLDVLVALGNGESFSSVQSWSDEFARKFDKKDYRNIVDLNRDGLSDLVGMAPDGLYVSVNTGSSFLAPEKISEVFSSIDRWKPNDWPLHFEDMNGDGALDITSFDERNLSVSTSSIQPLRLLSYDNGFGVTASFQYSHLNDPEVYQRYYDAEFPSYDYIGAYPVVKSMSVADGVGGVKTVEYQYEGFKFHPRFGGLGFKKRVVFDTKTKSRSVYAYSQDYENRTHGQVVSIESFNALDPSSTPTLSGATQYTYLSRLNGSRYFVAPELVSSQQYDQEGEPVSSTESSYGYDDNFNKKSFSVIQTDEFGIHRLTEESKYENSLDSGALSKPTRLKVTKSYFDKRLNEEQAKAIDETVWNYSSEGQLLSSTVNPRHERATKSEFTYNSRGLIVATKTSWPNWTKKDGFEFDEITVETSYDEYGYPRTTKNALGQTTKTIIDPRNGQVLSSFDLNGLETKSSWNIFGQAITTVYPDTVKERLERYYCSKAPSISCPNGAYTLVRATKTGSAPQVTFFDRFDRPIREVVVGFSGQKINTDTVYNEFGLVEKRSTPYFEGSSAFDVYWTKHIYDRNLLLDTKILPDGTQVNIEREGLKTTVINEKGHRKTTITDSRNRKVVAIDALGNETSYFYNSRGQLWRNHDVAGNATINTFDDLGLRTSLQSPDRGVTSYTYNRLSQLESETKANGWLQSYTYDKLGRVTQKVSRVSADAEVEVRIFEFDKAENGLGRLSRSYLENGGHETNIAFDSLSRPMQTTTSIKSTDYTFTIGYDSAGRISQRTFPTGLSVAYRYNGFGYQESVYNPKKPSEFYWKAEEYNAKGQMIKSQYGNGAVATQSYHPSMSYQLTSVVSASNSTVQNLRYTWDDIGNLGQREDLRRRQIEVFGYDDLNRLVSHEDSFGKLVTVDYDAAGNITRKSDVGAYTYGESCAGGFAGPHAVTEVSGPKNAGYCYDKSGYMTIGDGKSFTYSAIGKPTNIARSGNWTEIDYDADGGRYRRLDSIDGKMTETIYVGPYERVSEDGKITHKHYIDGIAVVTRENDVESTRFLHQDHLGSITSITDESGKLVESYSFDPWGQRRDADDFGAVDLEIGSSTTQRGFTGHEHLDTVGLIHMNGRVYDPIIARFTSADPIVQNPYFSQSLNRYSYVWNNPLNATDPSGFILDKVLKATGDLADGISSFAKNPAKELVRLATYNYMGGNKSLRKNVDKASRWIKTNERTLTAIAVTAVAFAVPATAVFAQSFWGSVALGAVNGYITSGGDLKATLIGAVSGGIFNGIGTAFGDNLEFPQAVGKVLAHGVAGGLRSAALGGNFEDGFRSSAISQTFAVSGVYKHIPQDPFTQAAASSTVGGVTSELTGGSFEDGAITALYSHMLNDRAHDVRRKIADTALNYVDSTDWSLESTKDQFGSGDFKCNKFVYDVASEAGAAIPNIRGGGVSGYLGRTFGFEYEGTSPPTASDWADPRVKIEGWEVVNDPQPGDIAASQSTGRGYTGHVGIVVGANATVSQSSKANRVVVSEWGFTPNVTYRRFKQ
ncbi:FG-GAP-like repeat-containing protein [Pseudobacteriovorax antillogorgiicola]|uniref:RHS repeat-associated core domain-containing protein n=1 Tax=Pseudobacteriovorax antillogorgiicola TaxID=1513793 RepID=A0A1Y6CRM8_9BACT|nr:FG-GAP-like repeat-containing protein [Pseudobacteriovorax antillogorgiicola]TCS41889.1 RHS repeat-associated protein [Pseudobacteriovorax antillogorgiicola]SMF83195.1 RHS repeat-associated core domain-containing protein [Pseudobacteriovorax antillogorgiicola]